MKIVLDENADQIELIEAMGSKNKTVAMEAQEIFAEFITPVVLEVLNLMGSASMIYQDLPFDYDTMPSIPLDLYRDETENYITVTSQSIAGGLATNEVSGIEEMKIKTYELCTSVSWLKTYARKHRLDVVAKAINRMTQTMLVKQERNAWAVLMKALAAASTNSLFHVVRSEDAGFFRVDDLSKLITRMRRVNTSFNAGTPEGSFGLTNLFVSPEVKEDIRGFAYNPLNPTISSISDPDVSAVAMPDGFRQRIYDNAGSEELYGIEIMDLVELGLSQKYNTLFDTYAASNSYTRADGTNGSTFAGATDEIIVGVDVNRDALLRPIERNEDGSTFTTYPDDQFPMRNDKMGFYGKLVEGRVCVDDRALGGILLG